MQTGIVNICRKIKQFIGGHWHTPCWLCNSPSLSLVCEDCLHFLPQFTPGCQRCGFPVLYAFTHYCEACFNHPPHFDQVHALFHYLWPVHHWIQQLKFQRKLPIADYFGQLMVERFRFVIQPDLILPVPLHPKRQKSRGFNQSIELAKPLAKALNLPLALQAAKRVKTTMPQARASGSAREMNVADAFKVEANVAGLSILIIDDVMTTGATVNELSLALKRAGAAFVQVGCVCRSC